MKKLIIAALGGALLLSYSLPIEAAGEEKIETKASLSIRYENENPIDINLRFGGIINEAKYNQESTYGVAVVKEGEEAKLTNLDLAGLEALKKDGLAMDMTPAKVEGGYQFAWVITNVEGKLNDKLSAALYEVNGATLTTGTIKTESVKTVVDKYLTDATLEYVHPVLNNLNSDAAARLSWANKGDILADGWTVDGKWDQGVGEGVDLHVDGNNGWSSVHKTLRVPTTTPVLDFGSRVFRRDGETYPNIQVKANGNIINAIGFKDNYVYIEHDQTQHFRYDLSAYRGQEIDLEIGINKGTHCPITDISFLPLQVGISYLNRTALLEGWNHSNIDGGVGEGLDIAHGDSGYIEMKNEFMVTADTDLFRFGSRVFNRPNETYPDYTLYVLVGDKKELVRAIGANSDSVHVDTDAIQFFYYDLSQYMGQNIKLRLERGKATHAVITEAGLR